jgi:hypothetical protein
MKKVVLSVVALAASMAPALAADLVKKGPAAAPVAAPAAVSPWDIAFGGVITTDYNFRGVSQSNRGPSAGAYFEPQFNTGFGTLYVGLAGYSIDWPSAPAYGFTDPSAEIDLRSIGRVRRLTASPTRVPRSISTADGAIPGARSPSISA